MIEPGLLRNGCCGKHCSRDSGTEEHANPLEKIRANSEYQAQETSYRTNLRRIIASNASPLPKSRNVLASGMITAWSRIEVSIRNSEEVMCRSAKNKSN